MVAKFDQSANKGSEDYLLNSKGINMIRLGVVIINREDPSCVVLNEREKGLKVLRSCCILLTRHLATRVEFADNPMKMALEM